MNVRPISLGVAVVLLLAACGEEQKPLSSNPTERAIQERTNHFKTIGDAFKVIENQVTSGEPDQAKIGSAVKTIAALAPEIPTWFPAGTGPESGFKTNALPEIWAQPEKFTQMHQEFMVEMNKLVTLAAAEPSAELTAQYYTTGVACANCHKPFRTKED